MTFYLYGLIDPRDVRRVMYAGVTSDLRARVNKHEHRPTTRLGAWVRSLRNAGLIPAPVILGQFDTREKASVAELNYIEAHRAELLNSQGAPASGPPATSDRGLLAQVEQAAIREALDQCHGNKLHAARLLGIGRQTLYNKLARMGAHNPGSASE